MRYLLLIIVLFINTTTKAQKPALHYFVFTLTDTLFHSEKSRHAYTYKYSKKKKTLTIYKPSGKLYSIHTYGATIKDMLVTYSGHIMIAWQPLAKENMLSIQINKHQPWPNAGVLNFTITNAGIADYCEIPYWHSSNITWDLSYAQGKPHAYKLIVPSKFIESQNYRDFTCLFKRTCDPQWEKITYSVADSAKPVHLFDSSIFLLRQQQINQQLLHVADSMMQVHFSKELFNRYFQRVCFQKLYTFYPDGSYTVNYNAPCIPNPDTLCRSADINYQYFNGAVSLPLKIKLSVFLENGGYGIFSSGSMLPYKKLHEEQLNLLTPEAVKEHMKQQFPAADFLLPSDVVNSRADAIYYAAGIPVADTTHHYKKFEPAYKVMEVSAAGQKWKGGYIYIAYNKNSMPQSQGISYYFDAVTGEFLYSTMVNNFLEETLNKL